MQQLFAPAAQSPISEPYHSPMVQDKYHLSES